MYNCIKPYNVRISTVRNRFGGRERISSHKQSRGISNYTVHFMYIWLWEKVKQENVSDNQQILNSIHCTYSCLITWMNLLFCSLKNLPVDCCYFCLYNWRWRLFNGSSNCSDCSAAWRHKTELNSCNSYSSSLIRLYAWCLLIDGLVHRYFILKFDIHVCIQSVIKNKEE